MAILQVDNLTKRYEGFLAVDEIDFSIDEGEVVGLLGPNGAGKTTTIQMLLGLTIPTTGSVRYFGKELGKHREYCLSRINYASAYTHMQSRLTVRQNLKIYCGLYGVKDAEKRITELSKVLNILPFMDNLYWHLSSGQKTRVILVRSLLNKPKLLLMDEPTASLDPEIKNDVVDLIKELQKKEKVAILYTSHDMQEVTRLCDRVIFLSDGRIVAKDSPENLAKMIGNTKLILTLTQKAKIAVLLKKEKLVHRFIKKHLVEIEAQEQDIPKIMSKIFKADIEVANIEITKPNLEDVFLHIAKR